MTERKAEIQGLRAMAVVSVLLFHVWPRALTGGYVGVDVFFVISGYLITGLLLREAEATGRISLSRFYERRVRRLLPAATIVLLAIGAFTHLLPKARWEDTLFEIGASALYVENWRLAWLAVDYLGAANEPSPVQHYWSLSIEEQFYVVWPLLIMAALAVGARAGPIRRTLLVLLIPIFCLSLWASITVTSEDPAAAYFTTHTRIWELALGALLALIGPPRFSEATREGMRVLGLAAIVIACVAFTAATPFPGAAALIPTVGCLLVIAAGRSESRWSLYRALAVRPVQYLGDISYSVYLWHWPLVVFTLVLLQQTQFSPPQGLLVIAAALALAAASKRFVEDPLRRPGAKPFRAIASGAASVAVIAGASGIALVAMQSTIPEIIGPERSKDYPGAAALMNDAVVPVVEELIPPLTQARRDVPEAYGLKCHLSESTSKLKPCKFGPAGATFRVLLAGDSHAANWIPTLEVLASLRGWQVETHTKSACPFLVDRVLRQGKPYESCYKWGQRLLRHIVETKPDVVIYTLSSAARQFDSDKTIEVAIAETWRPILDAGIHVVAIVETPRHSRDPVECLEADRACATGRRLAMQDADALAAASLLEPRVAVIDMTEAFCTQKSCPMAIGNIVAWRDKHHLTATYARTLADALGDRLSSALGRTQAEMAAP